MRGRELYKNLRLKLVFAGKYYREIASIRHPTIAIVSWLVPTYSMGQLYIENCSLLVRS